MNIQKEIRPRKSVIRTADKPYGQCLFTNLYGSGNNPSRFIPLPSLSSSGVIIFIVVPEIWTAETPESGT